MDDLEWLLVGQAIGLDVVPEVEDANTVRAQNEMDMKQFLSPLKATNKFGKRAYKCPIPLCNFQRSTRYCVLRHLCTFHGIVEEKACPTCEVFSSANLDVYNKHIKGCTLSGPKYKCTEEDCNYTTCYKSNLQNHELKHKPPQFSCDVCSKKFRYKRDIKIHKCLPSS